MNIENKDGTAAKVEQLVADGQKRQRSSIAFPYLDLAEALAMAKAIHNNVGSGTCTTDQAAAWIGMSPKSSGLRSRISTAALFGLINNDNADAIYLTDLGRMAIDPKREREGRAKAFLSVPLFRAVHDKHKGGMLPPAAALESELVSLGVASTLKAVARSVLERSAEKGGFFETGRDRLVMPGFRSDNSAQGQGEDFSGGGGGSGGGGELPPSGGIHPLIEVLMQALPEPGTKWSASARAKWLQALSKSFESIYESD